MDNEEFRNLVVSSLKAVGITIIICIPIALFYFNKYKNNISSVSQAFNNKDTFVIYVYSKKEYKKEIADKLKKIKVKYYEYDVTKQKDLKSISVNTELTEEELLPWSVIYIEDGSMVSNINDYDDFDGFLKYNNLIEK